MTVSPLPDFFSIVLTHYFINGNASSTDGDFTAATVVTVGMVSDKIPKNSPPYLKKKKETQASLSKNISILIFFLIFTIVFILITRNWKFN